MTHEPCDSLQVLPQRHGLYILKHLDVRLRQLRLRLPVVPAAWLSSAQPPAQPLHAPPALTEAEVRAKRAASLGQVISSMCLCCTCPATAYTSRAGKSTGRAKRAAALT